MCHFSSKCSLRPVIRLICKRAISKQDESTLLIANEFQISSSFPKIKLFERQLNLCFSELFMLLHKKFSFFIIYFVMSKFIERTKLTQGMKHMICNNLNAIKYLVSSLLSIFNILIQRSAFDYLIINARPVLLEITREIHGSFSIYTFKDIVRWRLET